MLELEQVLLQQTGVRHDAELREQQLAQAQTQVLGVNRQCLELLLDVFANLDGAACAKWGLPPPDSAERFSLAQCPAGMGWVVDHIVKPQTVARQCAFVDLFLGLRHFDVPCVGPATDFHSYTWREPVRDTFGALRLALPARMVDGDDTETRFVWFDIFCQNQHVSGDVGKTFSTAIKQVNALLFSTPNVTRPLALGRVWCLFEVMNCLTTPTCSFCPIGSYDSHKGGGDVEATIRQGMAFFREVESAQASRPEDKTMLLGRIEQDIPGGATAMNKTLREHFKSLFYTSLLCQCAFEGNTARVDAILQEFADSPQALKALVNAPGANHCTALHVAAEEGHLLIVNRLLASGANPNALTPQQETPLHQAAMEDHADVIRVLLQHGAKRNLRDDSGKTPYEVAAVVDSVDAAQVLRE